MMLSALFKGPFSVDRDWSLPELFQYTKEFAIVWILIVAYRIWRYPTLICLSLVFAFFLLDDSLQCHEKAGKFIANFLMSFPDDSVQKRDIGEGLALIIPVIVLGNLLLFAYVRDSAAGRSICRRFLMLIGLLAFCGVFIDLVLKSMSSPAFESVLTVVEDGSEMVIMSVILAYAIHLRTIAWKDPIRFDAVGAATITSSTRLR